MVDEKRSVKKKESSFKRVMRQLLKNKAATIGIIIFLIEVFVAILAPVISPYDPTEMDIINKLQGPSLQHLMGTDDLGRDLFSRVLWGARYSLGMGIGATAIGSLVGIIIGSVCGYFGGRVDYLLMRALDIIQAIPGTLLVIVVAAVLGTGFVETVIALSVGGIAGAARLLRASMLNVRQLEYIEASHAINCSKPRIILNHLLPNSFSPMIVSMTMGIAGTIVSAAALSFVGLGVQPPTPEWGSILSTGRNFMREHAYYMMGPGLAIMITVLSLNMFGDGLRDALDPKLKN